jgi:hypothetical protein
VTSSVDWRDVISESSVVGTGKGYSMDKAVEGRRSEEKILGKQEI